MAEERINEGKIEEYGNKRRKLAKARGLGRTMETFYDTEIKES